MACRLWRAFWKPSGSEAGYRRPAVVIQNNDFNKSNISTCIVVPLTGNMILSEYTPNVIVPKSDSRLSKDSVVVITLVTTVNKLKKKKKMSVMPKSYMKKISAGIIKVLELKEGM